MRIPVTQYHIPVTELTLKMLRKMPPMVRENAGLLAENLEKMEDNEMVVPATRVYGENSTLLVRFVSRPIIEPGFNYSKRNTVIRSRSSRKV